MSFIFILSYIDLVRTDEVELIDNHFLRKANDKEMEHINRELSRMRTSFVYESDYTSIYEYKIIGTKDTRKLEKLPKDEWKYYIIDFSKSTTNNHEINLLRNIFMTLKNPIYLGFDIATHEEDNYSVGHSYTWKSLYLELEQWAYRPMLHSYDEEHFVKVEKLHKAIKNLKSHLQIQTHPSD